MKLKKIFSLENIKVFVTFMFSSMLFTLAFILILIHFFNFTIGPLKIIVGSFWWLVIEASFIYSLVLYVLFQILFYFDR